MTFGTWNVQTVLQPGKMKEIADDVFTDLRKMGINEWREREQGIERLGGVL